MIVAKDLEAWAPKPPADYSMSSEVQGVERFARSNGWKSFHLVGFSAGATVALATALSCPAVVRTLGLIEPAYIGEDDWSPTEAAYRARMSDVFSLPPEVQQDAFRRAAMHPDEPVPAHPRALRNPTERGALLERYALRRCGFSCADLAAVFQPTLVVAGGRSHPHFAEVSDRLCEVLPNAEAATFPECHHLSSPQRHQPERLAKLLLLLWSRAQACSD
jgi:pimeloyl-ACP methyl ester carboxylesterase